MFRTDAQPDPLNNRLTVTQRAVRLFNRLSRWYHFYPLHNRMPVMQQAIPVKLKFALKKFIQINI